MPLNELWAEELEGHTEAWFSEGDVIVFDPGSQFQEMRKIVSTNPLRLDWPLDYFHSVAALIAVVPETIELTVDIKDLNSLDRLFLRMRDPGEN